jgi:hypothetical protein
MIVVQVIGRSFTGVLNYALLKDDATLVFSTLASTSINHMARELIAVCEQRPNLSRNVSHNSYSPNPADKMTDEQTLDFIAKHREGMGFGDTPYVVVKHEDTDKTHFHVVQSRVTFDAETVTDKNNYARNYKLTRALEKEFGLTVTEPNPDADKTPKNQRSSDFSPHRYIQDSLEFVMASHPTLADFEQALSKLNIESNIRFDSNDNAVGISFNYEDYSVSGTKVGYKLSTLKKAGINYERRANTPNTEQAFDHDEIRVEQTDRSGDNISNGTSVEMANRDQRDAGIVEQEASGFAKFFQRIKSAIDGVRAKLGGHGNISDGLQSAENSCRELNKTIERFNTTLNNELSQKQLNKMLGIEAVEVCKTCFSDPCTCGLDSSI